MPTIHRKTASNRIVKLIMLAVLLLPSFVLLAQPANDNAANAIPLSNRNNWCSAAGAYTNTGATSDNVYSSCLGAPQNDVWFKFQATTSYINIQVKTGGAEGSMITPGLVLWNSQGNDIGCVINGSQDIKLEKLNLVVGEWYSISVAALDWGSGVAPGTFTLCINDQAPFDHKMGALTLTNKNNWCSASAAYTNAGATSDNIYSSCLGAPQNDVWFKFQASTSYINIQVKTGGAEGSMTTPGLTLWNSQGNDIGCVINGSQDIKLEKLNLVVGEWYHISVAALDWGSGVSPGTFTLCINDQAPFDHKMGALTLTNKNNWCSASAAYTNAGATSDNIYSSCLGAPQNDVWFKFQATTSFINIQVKTGGAEGSMTTPGLVLWNSQGNDIGCVITGSQDIGIEKVNLVVGEWYHISVAALDWGGGISPGTFTLCVNDQPSFDYKAGALNLTDKNNWCSTNGAYTNAGATSENINSGCLGYPQNDVWFKFQATTPYINIQVKTGGAEGTMTSPGVVLWNSQGTDIGCVVNGSQDIGIEKLDLVVGEWYHISVAALNWGSGLVAGTFTLCLNDQLPVLTNKNNWCSGNQAFTSVNSKVVGPNSSCNSSSNTKTWFRFQAITPYIRVEVKTGESEGTIQYPEISIFNSGFSQIACQDQNGAYGDVVTEAFGLTLNEWYYVSVNSESNIEGTFALCVSDQFYELSQKNNWCSGLAQFTTVGSTSNGPTSSCEDQNQLKKWFKFQASTPYIKLDVKTDGPEGTLGHAEIALWNSDWSPVACKNSAGANADISMERFQLTVGQVYYVSVSTPYSFSSGTFTLCVSDQLRELTQKNNWCSSLSQYTTVGGTEDSPSSSCESANQIKTWFKFQAATPYIKLDVKTGGSEGTLGHPEIALWTSNLTEISCQNEVGSSADNSIEQFGLVVGQTYYVSVSTPYGFSSGTFTLCVNDQLKELAQKNDWCSSLSQYTTEGGTSTGLTSSCEQSNQVKTWFKIQAATAYLKVDVKTGGAEGTLSYPEMALWTSNGTAITCQNFAGSDADVSIERQDLVIGQTYYLSVSSPYSIGTFSICATDQIKTITNKNNWCSGLAAYTTIGGSSASPNSSCEATGQVKSWFKFQATTPFIRLDVKTSGAEGTLTYPEISLWNASFEAIACRNATGSNDDIALQQFDLVVGQTYFVSVSSQYSEGTFTLCANDQIPTLTTLNNWCSTPAVYSTAGAVQDGPTGACESVNQRKVWFKVQPSTSYLKIGVNTGGEYGSLQNSVISLWTSNFTEVTCKVSQTTIGSLYLEKLNLTAGATYYIAVSSTSNSIGTFSLCANDQIPTLTTLNNWCSTPAVYSTADAVQDGPTGACESVNQRKVWFKFQPSTSYLKIGVNTGGEYGSLQNSVISLWTSNFTEVTCKVSQTTIGSLYLEKLNLTAGATYYVAVSSTSNSIGTFSLCANDQIPTLTTLNNWCSTPAVYSTAGAVQDGPTGACESVNQRKVWFKFQPSTSYLKIGVNTGGEYGSLQNSAISLWTSNFTEVTCKVSQTTIGSLYLEKLNLTAGATYYIAVSSTSNSIGTFSLCANDQIPTLTTLNNWCSTPAVYSTGGAVQDGPAGACESVNQRKVWFKFQPSTSYLKIGVNTGGEYGSLQNSAISLWTSNFTEVTCKVSQTTIGSLYLEKLNLTAGATYYIAVSSTSNSIGTFSLCANDQIPTLTTLNNWCSTPAVYSTGGAVQDGPAGACESVNQRKVWFKFQPSTSYLKIGVNTGGEYGSLQNSVISLWTSNFTEVTCKVSQTTIGSLYLEKLNLTAGATYYIAVSSTSNSIGTFSLCANDHVQSPSINSCDSENLYSIAEAVPDGPSGTCENASVKKEWFKFQAATSYGKIIVRTGGDNGSMQNANVTLWTNAITQIACEQSQTTVGEISIERSDLTIGQSYYISVSSSQSSSSGTFRLCVFDNPVCLTPPTAFPITSTMSCSEEASGTIHLQDSESGFSYFLNGIDQKNGTGAAITWLNVAEGEYTISAQKSTCPAIVIGSTVVEGFETITARAVPAGLPQLCGGDVVTLYAFSEEGYSFQWLYNGSEIPDKEDDRLEVDQPGDYAVRVEANGCDKTSDPITIVVKPRPDATISYSGSTTICEGETIALNANTGTGITHQWQKKQQDGTYRDLDTETAATFLAKLAGEYHVVTTLDGCSATSTDETIVINELPQVSITASGPSAICPGEELKLKAVGEIPVTYQWRDGNGDISGQTSDVYIASATGSYRLFVENENCSIETDPIVVTVKSAVTSPTEIIGAAEIPAGDKLLYSVSGAATADVFLWKMPAGASIIYQNAQRSSALIGFHQLGAKTISVAAQKNGCESTYINKVIQSTDGFTSLPSEIPQELRATPERQHLPPLISRVIPLTDLSVGQVRDVFQAPPCLEGEYYVGFQLTYDLADRNTTQNWTAEVGVTFQKGANIQWTRPVKIDAQQQTFVSTIFHDGLAVCQDDYSFIIQSKDAGAAVPQENVYLRILLYRKQTEPFEPNEEVTLSCSIVDNMIQSSWTYGGQSAIAYELQWVFIEPTENFSGTYAGAFQFKEPVSITTGELNYKHHASYPTGALYLRARALGYNPAFPSHRIPGNWFYASSTPILISQEGGTLTLDANKNWQLQTVFAEDGKYKKVITYFDGTLRARQSQTNLSSEEMTLVGETYYDFEGRKSVDVLPVPIQGRSLSFKPGFNAFAAIDGGIAPFVSEKQKKFHYDNGTIVNSILDQTTGAGKYYSENNLVSTPPQTNKNYIPDADGYAYSQTEYLNDGTGRVRRQSGVGQQFAMEGGNATRYFYTEASRPELIRLFGTNVGNPSHYKKNVVVDPNGQASVSYIDQADRVVATALAGTPPANVDALPSFTSLPTTAIDVDISDKNSKRDGISQTIHKFLNEAPNTTYGFAYDLNSLGSALGSVCASCSYDLVISITDPDGKLMDLSGVAGNEATASSHPDYKKYRRSNLSTQIDCATPAPLSNVTFNLLLAEIGDYTITKTLTPRELTLEQLNTLALQNPTVTTAIANIEAYFVVDPGDCDICTSCPAETDALINEAISEIANADCENILQEIIQQLRVANATDPDYDPTKEEIAAHASYCEYEICVQDKASAIFEKQMARVDRWSVAKEAPYEYDRLVNVTWVPAEPTTDPFFTNEDSPGYDYRGSMQTKVNSIGIPGTTLTGTLTQVTDPDNTAYKVNTNGQPDVNGYHILYFSLQKRRSEMGETAYLAEVDKQRWTLFRNFYLDLKRKVKLEIPKYQNCVPVFNDLKMPDLLPQSTVDVVASGEAITNWGMLHGVEVDVTDEELDMFIARLNLRCSTLDAGHAASIKIELRAYFNSNKKNFLRQIFSNDIGVNQNLNNIQSILDSYGCSLASLATETICLSDTVVYMVDPQYYVTPVPLPLQQQTEMGEIGNARLKTSEEEEMEMGRMQELDEATATSLEQPQALMSVTVPSQAEYDALIDLYNATGGPNWTNKTGWTGVHGPAQSVAGWFGVTLNADGHVIGLSLRTGTFSGNNLVGYIPSSIQNLSYLQVLDLRLNHLTGAVPYTIGNLTNLTYVNFTAGNGNLSGDLTPFMSLVNLNSLLLDGNKFSGPVPSNINNLQKLGYLDLSNNQISGTIPVQLAQIPNLRDIEFNYNNMSGPIPAVLANLPLRYFELMHNNFTGEISPAFGNCPNLQLFRVDGNELTGQIPASFQNVPYLNWITAADNHFSGALPTSFVSPIFNNFGVDGNRYTFADLLPFILNNDPILTYTPEQDSVDVRKRTDYTYGSEVVLEATVDRNVPGCKYQWFRNGVPLNAESESSHTYTIASFSIGHAGNYHYTISHPSAVGNPPYTNRPPLVLKSRLQTLRPIIPVTICLEYAPVDDFKVDFDLKISQFIAECNENALIERQQLVDYAVENYLEEQYSEIDNQYRTNCLANAAEALSYSYAPKEHHYTLYYYDQAGNLVQTVPPAGVDISEDGSNPTHTLVTRYQYNSLNQLVSQKTPDAGTSNFYYNKKGQLRLSQNAQQAVDNKYSFTKYDQSSRITEVGEFTTTDPIANLLLNIEDPRFPDLTTPELPDYPLTDVTVTHYDGPNEETLNKLVQQNLRGRVSWVEVTDGATTNKTVSTYSYDIHGNVKSLLQKVPGLDFQRTDYAYDLVSGKVNYVFFQFGKAEQFIHKYAYDADNRITNVWTSSDAYIWNKEAEYKYYAHGPLSRTELGEYHVQGQDYYYTLQGWIKGVNMPFAGDLGADGISGSAVGKDVFAYTLGYYQNDYKPISNSLVLTDTRDQQWTRLSSAMGHTGLFNGNISWMTTDLAKIGDVNSDRQKGMQAMLYKYDQLHRIKSAKGLTSYSSATGFGAPTGAYDETYTYDGNGNILTLQRKDATAALVDDFNYQYFPNTNKLRFLNPLEDDLNITSGAVQPDTKLYGDINLSGSAYVPSGSTVELVAGNSFTVGPNFHAQEGASFTIRMAGETDGNYIYDKIGNLVEDKEQQVEITWTPYGKVREVKKMNSTDVTSFLYDAAGNRVYKKVVKAGVTTETHYVRDGSGNVMAVYTNTELKERPLYGSSRLGQYKGGVEEGELTLGKRTYELSNHLGNVLTVITDNVGMNGADVWAKVINTSDYYAFGLEMPTRSFTDSTAYRYGFNGKEKDTDAFGGTSYDYGFRIYNPRLAKFLSVDPMERSFSWNSPYSYAENEPISSIDLDGLEKVKKTNVVTSTLKGIANGAKEITQDAKALLSKETVKTIKDQGSDMIAAYTGAPGGAKRTAAFWTRFGLNTGFGISNMVNQPINFVMTMPERTADENAYQFGFAIGYMGPLIAVGEIPGLFYSRQILKPQFAKNLFRESPGPRTWYYYNSEAIGFSEAVGGGRSGFRMSLNIPEEYQKLGLGAEIFKRTVAEWEGANFTAQWVKSEIYSSGSSVNLQTFEKAVANGMTEQEAAWTTWSGQQAKKAGYKRVEVKHLENGGIQAEFSKE